MARRVSLPRSSNKHNSTRSATWVNTAKFVPEPSNVAPSGYADPGQISITHHSHFGLALATTAFNARLRHHRNALSASSHPSFLGTLRRHRFDDRIATSVAV